MARKPLGFPQGGTNLPLDVIIAQRGTLPDRAHPGIHTSGVGGAGPDISALASMLKSSIYRQGRVRDSVGTVGLVAARVLEDDPSRSYFFIQNQSATDIIVVRFGAAPSIGSGGQFVGVAIAPNFGFWEPIMVPTQECWLIASAAAVPYSITFGQ
jgi:hypothetical protein